MNTTALTKLEIIKALSLVPDSQMESIQLYIQSILPETKSMAQNNQSLKGI